MRSYLYCGNDPDLAGKTALINESLREGWVLAQFDDVSTGLGHGWHPFPLSCFRRRPDVEYGPDDP